MQEPPELPEGLIEELEEDLLRGGARIRTHVFVFGLCTWEESKTCEQVYVLVVLRQNQKSRHFFGQPTQVRKGLLFTAGCLEAHAGSALLAGGSPGSIGVPESPRIGGFLLWRSGTNAKRLVKPEREDLQAW